MKGVFYFYTVYGTIVFMALVIYFPLVYLNLVFTFDDLQSSDIPYYSNASSSYDRYGSMWWIIALDIFRFAGPLMACFCVALILLDKESYLPISLFYTIVFVILIIMEAAKIVIFTWQYVYCEDYQLCRNFDPTGNPADANYVFMVMWIYSIIFLVLFIIYSAMVSVLKAQALMSVVTSRNTSGAGGEYAKLMEMKLGAKQAKGEYYYPITRTIEDGIAAKKSTKGKKKP